MTATPEAILVEVQSQRAVLNSLPPAQRDQQWHELTRRLFDIETAMQGVLETNHLQLDSLIFSRAALAHFASASPQTFLGLAALNIANGIPLSDDMRRALLVIAQIIPG